MGGIVFGDILILNYPLSLSKPLIYLAYALSLKKKLKMEKKMSTHYFLLDARTMLFFLNMLGIFISTIQFVNFLIIITSGEHFC